jgi:hypothetical protein
MKRTPLLLVFGEHSTRSKGVDVPPNKKFFRSMVNPFIDGYLSGKGKRVAIIHEHNTRIDSAGMEPDGLKSAVAELEGRIQRKLDDTFARGIAMESNAMTWFDLGFMDKVLEINREAPGTIQCIIEPMNHEVQQIMGKQAALAAERRTTEVFDVLVQVETEIIRQTIEISRIRNHGVVRRVHELRAEDSKRAIIVPRGYAHKGMAQEFDPREYGITGGAHLEGVSWFSTEAIIESYTRELTKEDLEGYARLSIYYREYCSANEERYLADVGKHGTEAKARVQLGLDAKAYAHKMAD